MFYDRADAGEKLAKNLVKYQNQPDTLVLGMPRGGIVCAKVVANKLNLPLDIVIAKKISAPNNPEYAIGGVTSSGEPVLNDEVIGTMGITPDYLDNAIIKLRDEIKQKLELYRRGKKPLVIKNKNVIIVDDGVATGHTILAAVEFVKSQNPKTIIIAIPVAPTELLELLKNKVDDLICLETPAEFFAVGQFYEQFDQVEDKQVNNFV
ncbi:MAG: phosphoribosyl transferase protein [uncultured bacterium]|nr:MAG: phosphoribosyl transferase protein [uncultured bacterium]